MKLVCCCKWNIESWNAIKCRMISSNSIPFHSEIMFVFVLFVLSKEKEPLSLNLSQFLPAVLLEFNRKTFSKLFCLAISIVPTSFIHISCPFFLFLQSVQMDLCCLWKKNYFIISHSQSASTLLFVFSLSILYYVHI